MKTGDRIAWKYASGIAHGVVIEIHEEPTQIVSKGKWIRRNGTAKNPALIIEHKSGNDVLKLMSEVQVMKQ